LRCGRARQRRRNLTLGGNTKLVNPLAASPSTSKEPIRTNEDPLIPRLDSAELADQAIELYGWRYAVDVNFMNTRRPAGYSAAAELSKLAAFGGPRSSGIVTPQTLFRDLLPVT